jgi:diguanylate cyclase
MRTSFWQRDPLSFLIGCAASAIVISTFNLWVQFPSFSAPILMPSAVANLFASKAFVLFTLATAITCASALFVAGGGWGWVKGKMPGSGAPVDRHKLAATPDRSEIEYARNELDKQLGRLILLIAGQVQKTNQRQATLDDANRRLSDLDTAEELRRVVETLMSDNRSAQLDTTNLEARLRAAQAEADSLRSRLVKAEKLAMTDSLTDVANRRYFDDHLAYEIDKSHDAGTPLCLVLTDIDHFKRVNDSHGHAVGDRVLRSFASLLTKAVRANDLVARTGGEEFAIVLPNTPMGSAFSVAERIRSSIQEEVLRSEDVGVELGTLTASFGVAEIKDGEDARSLIARTDEKLYEAKNSGRNRTVVWASAA